MSRIVIHQSQIYLLLRYLVGFIGIALAVVLLITYSRRSVPESHSHGELSHASEHAAMIIDDHSFLEHMVPHHLDAVEASKVVAARSTDPKVRAFASRVAADQKSEIVTMKQWYQEWYGAEFPTTTSYMAMMTNYQAKSVEAIDSAYLSEMITHHQSAIASAQLVSGWNGRNEVKDLAASIIATQQSEITEMQSLMKPGSSSAPAVMQHSH